MSSPIGGTSTAGEATIARILIIDDDAALRRMMAKVLVKARHEVIESTDGIDGLRKFRSEEPEVVISDIMMPHRDGIETIRTIREHGSNARIIAISGGGVRAGELYLSIAQETGADAVVQKPFRAAELVTAVDELLKETPPKQ